MLELEHCVSVDRSIMSRFIIKNGKLYPSEPGSMPGELDTNKFNASRPKLQLLTPTGTALLEVLICPLELVDTTLLNELQ